MAPTKIGLVGIGKIAQTEHVPAIRNSEDWELAATVSRHGQVEGVPGYTSIEDMLDAQPDIEVVSLCVPPGPRFDYARTALLAGRHVMLEKPPGATLAECHALTDIAHKAGVSLFATWHSREAEMVEDAREWLSSRNILGFQMLWKEDVRYWHPGQDWVFEPAGMGVFDPGINGLSVLTRILPEPVHITSAELEFPANRHTPIAAEMTFWYPGATGCRAELDWLHPGDPMWSIIVQTDEGELTVKNGGAHMFVDGEEVRPRAAGAALSGEYPRLYARMAELLRQGASDVDLRPMTLVADAFAIAGRREGPVFEW